MQLLLQISSAQGPVECCKAVALAFAQLEQEAHSLKVKLELLEASDGPAAGTYRSILLLLEGENAAALAHRWCGTIQWICASTFRPRHKRKNWFIGVTSFPVDALPDFKLSEITFDTMRASGPGGQHVNKTESAVRATHMSTGISVKVQNGRSQHANKNMAILLLRHKLEEQKHTLLDQQRMERWQQHYQLERGNSVRTFTGEKFKPTD